MSCRSQTYCAAILLLIAADWLSHFADILYVYTFGAVLIFRLVRCLSSGGEATQAGLTLQNLKQAIMVAPPDYRAIVVLFDVRSGVSADDFCLLGVGIKRFHMAGGMAGVGFSP